MKISKDNKSLIFDTLYTVDIYKKLEMLYDDCFDDIIIGNLSFEAARIVRELDPIAFREEALNYADCLVTNGELIEINGSYFYRNEVDEFLEKKIKR